MSTASHALIRDAHQNIRQLFREPHRDVAEACRAARDEYAALPRLDPEDPAHWKTYRILTSDLQTLLSYLMESGVPSSTPGTFRTLVMNVLYYLSMANRSKAGLILARTVYGEWSRRLLESHVDVIYVAERQAACHLELGEGEAAAAVMKKVLSQREATLGKDHPTTLNAAVNLGTCLNDLDDFHAALRLNQETLRRCRARLDPDDDITLNAASHLGASLFGLQEYPAALTIFRDVAARRAAAKGPTALDALRDASDVALTLERLDDHESARVVYERVYRDYKNLFGMSHESTQHAQARLVRTLRALGRTDEADEVRGVPWARRRDWTP